MGSVTPLTARSYPGIMQVRDAYRAQMAEYCSPRSRDDLAIAKCCSLLSATFMTPFSIRNETG